MFARVAAVAVVGLALAGCIPMMQQERAPPPIPYSQATEKQVDRALQRYAAAVVAMDPAAIANTFAPDGVWERQSGSLVGREAIRAALSSNSGVRVLTNEMTTMYISYLGPAVQQSGVFKQSVRLANGKIVHSEGRFEATWVRGPGGEWWISRMVARPQK